MRRSLAPERTRPRCLIAASWWVLARAADFPFGHEGPIVLTGAVVEQALESGADGAFVGDAEVVELAQGGVVILDRLVRGPQFQPLHGGVLHPRRGDGNAGVGLKSNGRAQRQRHFSPHPGPCPSRCDGATARRVGRGQGNRRQVSGEPRLRAGPGRELPERLSRRAPLNQCQPRPARQRLGVRWVRGEGTHRFRFDPPQACQSGVSPVPRQPPHSKTSRQFGRFRAIRPDHLARFTPRTR